MVYGGSASKRRTSPGGVPRSLAGWAGIFFEILGLLNKGSAKAPAAPDAGQAAQVQPISSNTLNVTRVGGIGTLISAAGGAALLIFNVNKTTDRAPVVVAAYLSIGAIVTGALLTVAIIIAADVRARAAVATAAAPQPPRAGMKLVTAQGMTSLAQVYDLVLVSAANGNVELALPSAGSVSWQQMTIKRGDADAGRTVTLRPQAQQTIAGQAQRRLDPAGSVQVYSDGRNWLAV